jgi:hypothetical protein
MDEDEDVFEQEFGLIEEEIEEEDEDIDDTI